MRLTRIFFVAFVLVAMSGPAVAHGDLQSTDPERGTAVERPPKSVRITFTEAPTDDGRFEVLDGCGDDVFASLDRRRGDVELQVKEGESGRWTVTYRVISAVDGHATRGNFSFKVRGVKHCDRAEPGPTEDVAQPPPPVGEEPEGFPIVPVLIGAGVVVAAVVVRLIASRSA
ncbi:MAG TPA: copper resistance CopC family protein [Actinomycetota bacterium]|nr:copper resistance CopC family protein [Actinomycetota bacterium]